MRFSNWSDGSSPIFLDPTFDEIQELAKNRVDTLRVCEDENHVALASGYGNTHTSVTLMARKVWPKWFPACCILYRIDHVWNWNFLDMTIDGKSQEKVGFERGLSLVTPQTKRVIKDFVMLHVEVLSEAP